VQESVNNGQASDWTFAFPGRVVFGSISAWKRIKDPLSLARSLTSTDRELLMRRDLDDVIQGWPYDPEPGEVLARELRARDGRSVLQIRVELGVLQLEITGRPDGTRPHGFATFLDYLRYSAASRGQVPGGQAPPWTMDQEHRDEADREFVQFFHRRSAWLSLRRYDKALLDADHTLALMDFVRRHGNDDDYIATHEQSRGLVQFHRTQAQALLAIERRRPEEAIDALREGMEKLATHQRTWWDARETESSESPNVSLIEQLRVFEQEVRKNYAVEKTLREQLDEAVAREDYEQAARLRDMIRAQTRARR
jgi:UvrB/uvrC motif